MEILVLAVDALVIGYALWMARMMWRARVEAPYVRTRRGSVSHIVEAFGVLPEDSVFYELGAGDGHVLVSVARANPGARCIGIERDLVPYLLLKLRILVSGVQNVEARRENMFAVDLSRATHIYTYLYPQVLDALLPKLERELKGAELVSLDFRFSTKEPAWERRIGVKGLGTWLVGYRF